ncbi:hypothetical protein [Microbacterium rhizosphaerae]|uniref:Cell division protein FtsL n=1 Tax=Microbacterium rhizosphaerae TaxID=1678237 RepID=A0ABZ0SQZ9_9MICO|nr:hypothetical protein [Microbacterium rhizosphaerae]WPR91180.1 hypothetical protein SM116_07815 [Microbacterium rhizosphaerae]
MTIATTAAAARTAPAPRRETGQTRLRAIESRARRRRPRLAYALVAIAGVLAIGAAQMTLSIMTTQSSFALSQLTQQQRTLTLQKQVLYDDVAGLSSPQYLAANASALGMIVAESPSYLRLSDGAVLGTGAPATGASSVDVTSRGSVPNALIAKTPLVTDPAATVGGDTSAATPASGADGTTATGATQPDPATPPPLTDGLPSPSTH